MKKSHKGLIILVHDVLGTISDEEIIATIPEDLHHLPRQTIRISPEKITHGEAMNYHWQSMLIEQDRIFDNEVAPVLDKHGDYLVLYFGLAPIPLAVHLGHKVGGFRRSQVYLKPHTPSKNEEIGWIWPDKTIGHPEIKGVPKETFGGFGEVVIRFGTRYRIEASDTRDIVQDPVREIELYPNQIGADIFGSVKQVSSYAEAFREALDAISSHLPEVRDVHLFAAIPVGLAFMLGQEISPTSHPLVHVYEYAKDLSPSYYPAYTVNEDLDAIALEISSKERESFRRLRDSLKQELDKLTSSFMDMLSENPETYWFRALSPEMSDKVKLFQQEYWKYLPRLDKAQLKTSFLKIEETGKSVYEGNYFFDDVFMKLLTSNLKSREEQIQAARIFSFRETIHQSAHRIRSENSVGISSYIRVMEEADYQADVYSLLHEFFYTRLPIENAGVHFCKMIHILLETLWAFERSKGKSQRMEIQRLNRFLTWYYLTCKLEVSEDQNLEEVLSLFAHKPIIELRMRTVHADARQKMIVDLKTYNISDLGICVFHKGKVVSFGNEIGQLPLTDLIDGFKNSESEKIKEVIRSLISKLL